MWIQSIAVGYLQYARIVYVFLTRIFIFYLSYLFFKNQSKFPLIRCCYLNIIKYKYVVQFFIYK